MLANALANVAVDESWIHGEAATLLRLDGISVFEVPNGDFDELCTRVAAMSERSRIRTAFASAVRHAGFPLLDTAGPLHWTIVLPDVEQETLDRLRNVFSPPRDNPGFRRRT